MKIKYMIVLVLVFCSVAYAAPSFNPLTKQYADTLYPSVAEVCIVGGACTYSDLNVTGDYTILHTTEINATGPITMSGPTYLNLSPGTSQAIVLENQGTGSANKLVINYTSASLEQFEISDYFRINSNTLLYEVNTIGSPAVTIENAAAASGNQLLLDGTGSEAFLVRKKGDTGDVFSVNTASDFAQGNNLVALTQVTTPKVNGFAGGTLNLDASGVTSQNTLIADLTTSEAFLVRKDGDTGDVFSVDTSNNEICLNTECIGDWDEVNVTQDLSEYLKNDSDVNFSKVRTEALEVTGGLINATGQSVSGLYFGIPIQSSSTYVFRGFGNGLNLVFQNRTQTMMQIATTSSGATFTNSIGYQRFNQNGDGAVEFNAVAGQPIYFATTGDASFYNNGVPFANRRPSNINISSPVIFGENVASMGIFFTQSPRWYLLANQEDYVLKNSSEQTVFNITETGYTLNTHPYSEMWTHNDAGVSLNFAVASTYYTQNLTGNYSVNGFTFIPNSTLQADIAGKYKVNYHATGSGVANHNYHSAIQINNVVQYNTESHMRMGTGNDVSTMAGTGLLNLEVGDNVTLAFEDSTGTGTGTVYSINVNLLRIGD